MAFIKSFHAEYSCYRFLVELANHDYADSNEEIKKQQVILIDLIYFFKL